jgi:hypothetical protein
MKRVVFIVLAALLVSMSLIFAVSAAGTPTPEVKVDDDLGVLAAFFNFDNAAFKTPTYAAYAVKIADEVNNEALVGPSDDARFPSMCIDVSKLTGVQSQINGFSSPLAVVKNVSSELPAWPDGKQTIKLKVMVRSETNGGGTRTYYNGDGTYAYQADAPLSGSATSGANANRDTWRDYSRTAVASANWNFFHWNDADASYTQELIDDIEIWVYPSNGFILKSAETATDGNMITCADETYTFPTVFSLYPLSSATQWTDGTDVYDANDVVSAATLYGKSFYATGSGGGGTEPPAGDLTNYVASSNNTFEIEYTGLPGSYYALVILDGIAAPDAAPVVTESSVLFIDQKTANDQGVVTFSDVLLKEDGRPGSVYIGGGNLQKAVLLGYVNNNASGTNFVVSGNITSDSALPAKVKLVSETDSSKSFEVSTAAGSYEISVPEDVYTFTVTKKAHTSYTKTGFTVDADVVKNATIKGGDFGGDGVVNFDDFSGMLMVYGTTSADYDINGDGVVNFDDFSTLLMNYNAASVTE